jgi:hypothetical protein
MNRVNVHVADGKQQQFIPILGVDFQGVVDHVLTIGDQKDDESPLAFLEDIDTDVFVDVDSDWIKRVGYNFADEFLSIELIRGDVLRFDAGPDEFRNLVEINERGESVGEYYHSDIKKYTRV